MGLLSDFGDYMSGTKKWKPAWERWNANALHPRLLREEASENVRVYSEVVEEYVSKGGKRAVIVGHAYRAVAVHEFRANGEASPRGPYWVKTLPCSWEGSGRMHIATVARCKAGYSIKSSHPKQTGAGIEGQLLQITEFDTASHPPIDLVFFAIEVERNPQRFGNPSPIR
jgi:hypothetical protein